MRSTVLLTLLFATGCSHLVTTTRVTNGLTETPKQERTRTKSPPRLIARDGTDAPEVRVESVEICSYHSESIATGEDQLHLTTAGKILVFGPPAAVITVGVIAGAAAVVAPGDHPENAATFGKSGELIVLGALALGAAVFSALSVSRPLSRSPYEERTPIDTQAPCGEAPLGGTLESGSFRMPIGADWTRVDDRWFGVELGAMKLNGLPVEVPVETSERLEAFRKCSPAWAGLDPDQLQTIPTEQLLARRSLAKQCAGASSEMERRRWLLEAEIGRRERAVSAPH